MSSTDFRSIGSEDPDPAEFLLNLENLITRRVNVSLTRDQTISLRNRHIPSSCALHFEKSPMKVTRASGQYLYDDLGMEFLDCVNCVAHVGHCHPKVVRAGIEAMSKTGYVSIGQENIVSEYVSKLKTTLPVELDTFLFVTSASEANDLAVQLARLWTGGTEVIAVEGSFHGSLSLTTDMSTRIYQRVGFSQMPNWLHVIPCPDTYRGKYREDDPNAAFNYAEDAKNVMAKAVKSGKKLCCYIGEPIMNAAGMIIPPPEWTQSVYRNIGSMGGLVIADEAQSGLGRCGFSWWSFQTQGVVPDIITIGKPLGNGHPMALVVTRAEIAKKLRKDRLRNFVGDNVTAAIGSAVISSIRNENLQMNARNVGSFLLQGLRALISQHRHIGHVRGMGLMIGVEIVYNQESRKPAKILAEQICYRMKENNIIIGNDGIYKNVLVIIPPMCFTCQNAHHLIVTLDKVLTSIEEDDESNLQAGTSSIPNYTNYSQPGQSSISTASTSSTPLLITPEMLFVDPATSSPYSDLNPFEVDTRPEISTAQYEEMD